jgi:hypothetical protein
MSAKDVAKAIEQELATTVTKLRKTASRKISELVAGLVAAQSVNTGLIATCMPAGAERRDMREQRVQRGLETNSFTNEQVLEPYAKRQLAKAAENGRKVVLSMDQTEIGGKHAILVVAVSVGKRAFPLAWAVEPGEANIGAETQVKLLEQVAAWLPEGVTPILMADRFYGSVDLLVWLKNQGWDWRIRLKESFLISTTEGQMDKIADFNGRKEYYDSDATLFEEGIPTSIGWIHEAGHKEGWAIAMNCPANKASVLDYGLRWGIEAMFSDFKSRGFDLAITQMKKPKRLARMLLFVALAMEWCIRIGEALKKKLQQPAKTIQSASCQK